MTINLSEDTEITNFVACCRGMERSPLVVRSALKKGLINTLTVTGGMLALSRLSAEDIKALYPHSQFVLISDRADGDDCRKAFWSALYLLEEADIPYSVADNLEVKIFARSAGFNPDQIHWDVPKNPR